MMLHYHSGAANARVVTVQFLFHGNPDLFLSKSLTYLFFRHLQATTPIASTSMEWSRSRQRVSEPSKEQEPLVGKRVTEHVAFGYNRRIQ